MDRTTKAPDRFLDGHGINLPVLKKAMNRFARSVPALPEAAACRKGCAFCCHLRVDVSIPELIVIFNELSARATEDEFTRLRTKIRDISEQADPLQNNFRHTSRLACPFLDDREQCLIYAIRPFSCRAFHSIDAEICRQGFENRCEVQVPCFPLYLAAANMFASTFIRVMADRGYASYLVGYVKGLDLLFDDASLTDQWLAKKDVFKATKI